jgi:hypothetical protein
MPAPAASIPFTFAPMLQNLATALLVVVGKWFAVAVGMYFAFFALRLGVGHIMMMLGGFDKDYIAITDQAGNTRWIGQKKSYLQSSITNDIEFLWNNRKR